jgi:hypothetical protein
MVNQYKKGPKGYNENNPMQPQGSIKTDKSDEKPGSYPPISPNEKLSIPERKLKKDKNNKSGR